VKGLGERPAILRNIFKRYPFCLGCFEPLEGLRHFARVAVRSATDIDVRADRDVAADRMDGRAADPHDEFQAKFSAPYALALVLAGTTSSARRCPRACSPIRSAPLDSR
jgi:2-methylcitrate dehydratase PrpD